MYGNTGSKACHSLIYTIILTELLSGPLEVGYPILLSGYEKPFAKAMQTLWVNLASELAIHHICMKLYTDCYVSSPEM